MLIMLRIKAPPMAGQKPCTEKPARSLPVNQSISPLMTKVNNPSVSTLMGKVSTRSTGRISALNIPKKSAVMKAQPPPPTWMPSKR